MQMAQKGVSSKSAPTPDCKVHFGNDKGRRAAPFNSKRKRKPANRKMKQNHFLSGTAYMADVLIV